MLISGVLLSEKHPKTYQLGLWFFDPTSILTHFRSPFPPLSALKNKDLPPCGKKKVICPSRPPPQKSNVPSLRYLLNNSKMSFVPERMNFIPRLHAR